MQVLHKGGLIHHRHLDMQQFSLSHCRLPGESHSVSRPEWKSDAFCLLQILTHRLLLVLMLSPLVPTF